MEFMEAEANLNDLICEYQQTGEVGLEEEEDHDHKTTNDVADVNDVNVDAIHDGVKQKDEEKIDMGMGIDSKLTPIGIERFPSPPKYYTKAEIL